MKYLAVLFFLITFSFSLFSQNIVIDSTFGDNGKLQIELVGDDIGGGVLFDAEVMSDGSYVAHAYLEKNDETYALYKITEEGEVDTNFGTNGSIEIITYDEGYIPDMIILDDDKIVVTAYDELNVVKIYIFNSDGSVYNILQLFPDSREYYSVNIEYISNHLFIGGTFVPNDESSDSIFIIKSTIDGIIDTEFGEKGMFKFGVNGYSGELYSMVNQNGSLVVCGSESPSDNTQEGFTFLMRISTEGNIDDNFGENGIIIFEGFEVEFAHLFIADNQDIYMTIFGYGVVLKMDKDGNVYNDYGFDGYAFTEVVDDLDLNMFFSELYSQDIYMFGFGPSLLNEDIYRGIILKYNEQGKLDSTFGEDGISYTDFDDNTQFYGGLFDNNGRILATGGSGMGYDLPMNLLLVRYKTKTSATDELTNLIIKPHVYPNPVSDNRINLTYNLQQSYDVELALYNINAEKLSNLKLSKSSKGMNFHEIELPNNLNQGMYYLQLKSDINSTIIKFCVVE